MRCIVLLTLMIGIVLGLSSAGNIPSSVLADSAITEPLQCIAFSPYVAGHDPRSGPHPPPQLIETLLDVVVRQTGFGCIMSYGVLNGLDYIFEATKQRGLKVIAIVWLDTDASVNNASVTTKVSKKHSSILIRSSGSVAVLSCA